MTIAIASDHAGFPLKEEVRDYVSKLGHEVQEASFAESLICVSADFTALSRAET